MLCTTTISRTYGGLMELLEEIDYEYIGGITEALMNMQDLED